ncbi:hypothetical protein ABPG74_016971 [Tetrahymena malaccensis]
MGDNCQNNLFSQDYTQENIKLKRRRRTTKKDQNSIVIQKRKYQKKKKTTALPTDNHFLILANTILIDSGLQVSEGIFRFLPYINQISFNYQDQKVQRIEEKHDLGIVDVQFQKSSSKFVKKQSQITKYLNQIDCVTGYSLEDISNTVDKYLFIIDQLLETCIYNSKKFEIEIDNLLGKVIDAFQKKVLQIKKENQSQFFFYQISILDVDKREQELIHMGYSKQYLDLLGLDKDIISQIFLRNKRIDLFENLQDISKQALKGIFDFVNAAIENRFPKQENFESNIVTFDGYPIKIFQRKQTICHIELEEANFYKLYGRFLLTMVDIDVEPQSLQQLIQYRQRISIKSNSKIDMDFIRRENSFLFEDVEYSIESQQFIERFYGLNLLNLQYVQQQIDEKSKQCCYKVIGNK